jgi:hypothetical protein
LVLYKRSKKSLLGFFEVDVPEHEVPHLFIKYKYKGVDYEKEIADMDALTLPSFDQ